VYLTMWRCSTLYCCDTFNSI